MSARVLILRPQPGADESAERARALGLEPVIAPLFTVRPLGWDAPDPALYDAVMVTSANAPRHAGAALAAYTFLPCYAVGRTSGEAARAAGFGVVHEGPSDGAALVEIMAADGIGSALHLCGREHIPLAHPKLTIDSVPVYAAEAAERLPDAAGEALAAGALALAHSPRAAETLARLVPDRSRIRLAVISPNAAVAAGQGWASVHAAAAPRDAALLELAAKLCQGEPGGEERWTA